MLTIEVGVALAKGAKVTCEGLNHESPRDEKPFKSLKRLMWWEFASIVEYLN